MQVLVCEMMIYWCDLYKKSLLHFLGIGVLQVRRPRIGDLWDIYGLLVAFYKHVSIIMLQKSSARKGFCAEDWRSMSGK